MSKNKNLATKNLKLNEENARQESLNQLEELSNLGTWEIDIIKNSVSYSDNLYNVYGIEKGVDLPSKDLLMSILLPQYVVKIEEAINLAVTSKKITKLQVQIKRKSDQKIIDIIYSGKVIFEGDKPIKVIGSAQDITENLQIKRHSEELSDLIKYSSNEVYIVDATTYQYVYVNQGAVEALGYSYDELMSMSVLDTNPKLTKAEADLIKKNALKKSFSITRTMHQRKDGSTYHVQAYIHPLKYNNHDCFVLFDTDISEVIQLEEKLQYQVNHDILTGLPNRALLKDRLNQALKASARNKERFALLFIDLDKFKQINDSLGHDIGDKVLVEASSRLRDSIRAEDTLARVGGDEFVIILRNLKEEDCSAIVSSKIIKSVRKEMEIDGHTLFISASVGISLCPNDATNESSLVKFSDMAMYKAKEKGDSFVYYSDM